MQIVFARHGESYANVNNILSNTGLKYGLTSTGREQAVTLGRNLQDHGITRAFCSTILRAIETTVLAANELGVDYEAVDALREVHCGVLEGRSDKAAWDELMSVYQAWTVEGDHEQRIEGGENVADIHARFLPFLEGLIREYGETDERILCVSHGGMLWMILPYILHNLNLPGMRDLGMDYTTYVVTEFGDGRLIGLNWNGTAMDPDEAPELNASSDRWVF